jgi:cation diffusion facilitator family transporter
MSSNKVEMMKTEERLLAISIFALVAIGIMEVAVGYLASSIALMADGAHSFADSVVSVLVLTGIRLARRRPDGKFHHGYGRAETLFGLMAAMLVVATGAVILYESYLALFIPNQIVYPELAVSIAILAGAISTSIAVFKLRIARRVASSALRVDAYNSLKDGSASFVVIGALVLSSLGFHYFDALGGMVISVMILAVAYISIKESSIVLMDGCICGDIFEDIFSKAEQVPNVKHLRNLKLRQIGRSINVEAVVELDGQLSITQAEEIISAIKKSIIESHPEISKVILETTAAMEKPA